MKNRTKREAPVVVALSPADMQAMFGSLPSSFAYEAVLMLYPPGRPEAGMACPFEHAADMSAVLALLQVEMTRHGYGECVSAKPGARKMLRPVSEDDFSVLNMTRFYEGCRILGLRPLVPNPTTAGPAA